jgi:hypothetical protein
MAGIHLQKTKYSARGVVKKMKVDPTCSLLPMLLRLQRLGMAPPDHPELARTTAMRLEPKTFFANERTFLAWLHMAVTLGSISAALLGFAAGVLSALLSYVYIAPYERKNFGRR